MNVSRVYVLKDVRIALEATSATATKVSFLAQMERLVVVCACATYTHACSVNCVDAIDTQLRYYTGQCISS